MSLRDYFAAAALPSLQMWCLKVAELGGSVFNKAEIASMAYEQADAMLAERSKP
jgi:hypothetical protein